MHALQAHHEGARSVHSLQEMVDKLWAMGFAWMNEGAWQLQ